MQSSQRYATASPASQTPSSRGWVSRKQRPPQSMHVIVGGGSNMGPLWRDGPYSAPMRVVAGELGGRKLVSPEGTSTRPTTDRVREAVFNALGSAGLVEGALVADLFAGTGAVGIEAISRGAAHCTFVERDRNALRALEENIDTLGVGDRSRVVRSDAVQASVTLDVDIVFADPPYDFSAWDEFLANIRAGFVVAESGRALSAQPRWTVTRTKRYGRTWVSFLERDAK